MNDLQGSDGLSLPLGEPAAGSSLRQIKKQIKKLNNAEGREGIRAMQNAYLKADRSVFITKFRLIEAK